MFHLFDAVLEPVAGTQVAIGVSHDGETFAIWQAGG